MDLWPDTCTGSFRSLQYRRRERDLDCKFPKLGYIRASKLVKMIGFANAEDYPKISLYKI
jgi:hypothetical protein